MTPPSTNTTTSPADQEIPPRTRPDATAATPGVVTGRPLTWLQIDGLTVAGAGLVIFATTG